MVKQRDLLGNTDRIVPRQDNNHRAQLHMLGFASHVREELENIRDHGVIVEMMLDRPYRVKSQGFGHFGEPQFLTVDFGVRQGVIGVLTSYSVTNMHNSLLCLASVRNLPVILTISSSGWKGQSTAPRCRHQQTWASR